MSSKSVQQEVPEFEEGVAGGQAGALQKSPGPDRVNGHPTTGAANCPLSARKDASPHTFLDPVTPA
ncbi:hypothetical protein [Streptomyces caeruleatus]|uniref:hypothetical protein n=1 Tax=Streptomyces caeruleatus TaxID=661399 RepID=UPI001ABEE91E|nr:hypothetical protein [Streptomyces caeruleatus]